jgi:hypothetical protein
MKLISSGSNKVRETLPIRNSASLPRRASPQRRKSSLSFSGMMAAFARQIFAHPQKAFAVLVFSSGALAITTNALVFQKMRHPAPLFNDKAMVQVFPTGQVLPLQSPAQAPVPPARPVEAAVPIPISSSHIASPATRPLPARDAIADMLKTDPAAQTGSNRNPDVKPDAVKSLAAVQRSLIKLGYGPLSSDGKNGPETRRAIERFEKDHRLPVTGELNSRLTRELVVQLGE